MLFKLLLILTISAFIFEKFTRKYADSGENTLDLYVGKKRSGKTTILTALAIKYLLKGKKVYANYDIPGCYRFDPTMIGFRDLPANSVAILDEIGIVFNNRSWESFDIQKIEWFKLQGHHKVKVIIATQSPTDFDKVIRELVDRIFIVKKLFRIFIISRRVTKTLDIANSEGGQNVGGNIVFRYSYAGLPRIYLLPRYTPFFDSFALPEIKEEIASRYNDISEMQRDLMTIAGTIKYYVSHFFKAAKLIILTLINKLISGKR